jgi:hypothetical protein
MTFPLAVDGLRLPTLLGLDAKVMQHLAAQRQTVPSPTAVRAQIDTGTVVTAVSPGILASLKAVPGPHTQTQTAGGLVNVRFFLISFTLFDPTGNCPATLSRISWLVTDLPQDLPDVEVLFGMDLLREVILTVNGPAGEFSLDI